jgi:hypothetical protein
MNKKKKVCFFKTFCDKNPCTKVNTSIALIAVWDTIKARKYLPGRGNNPGEQRETGRHVAVREF